MEMVAELAADECNQFVGVMELSSGRGTRGQVAAQGDEMADAVFTVAAQDVANVVARRTDAGDMRCRGVTGSPQIKHGAQRAFAGRAAGAVSHRKEFRIQRCQLFGGLGELVQSFRRVRREELEAESAREFFL